LRGPIIDLVRCVDAEWSFPFPQRLQKLAGSLHPHSELSGFGEVFRVKGDDDASALRGHFQDTLVVGIAQNRPAPRHSGKQPGNVKEKSEKIVQLRLVYPATMGTKSLGSHSLASGGMSTALSDILIWSWAVLDHWQVLMTGGFITAILSGIQYRREQSIPWKMARRIMAGFLLVAFFLAWRDQHEKVKGR